MTASRTDTFDEGVAPGPGAPREDGATVGPPTTPTPPSTPGHPEGAARGVVTHRRVRPRPRPATVVAWEPMDLDLPTGPGGLPVRRRPRVGGADPFLVALVVGWLLALSLLLLLVGGAVGLR